MSDLLPCPFCGGVAECDSRQAFRTLSSGRLENRFAIYCTSCTADMGFCYSDIESCNHEAAKTEIITAWNTRGEEPCTDCGGTGTTYQTERPCACLPVASHPVTSSPVVSQEPAETSDNDLVERVARTLGIALARDVEKDVYASETCIEERRCIAASLLPIINQEREAAARAALEAAVVAYQAETETWLQLPMRGSCSRQGAKVIRAIDPAAFRGADNATSD